MTAFEGATKPTSIEVDGYEGLLSANRIVEIPSNMQFRAAYASTDGLPTYCGFAAKGLAEGTNGWLLKEYTYDASRQCTKILIAYGNWTNRASESYS
jgi:hypothetical protein